MKMKSAHPIRVLTCCYCGARSTLGREKARRLVCHGCGAPVRYIRDVQPVLERKRKAKSGGKPGCKPAIPHKADRSEGHLDKDRPARRRKGKRRRRSVWYHVSEAFDDWDDWIEDVVDFFD